jgi:hypothetical protein
MINSASRPRHSTEGILRPFTQAILVRHLLHVFRRLVAMIYPELPCDSRKNIWSRAHQKNGGIK